MSDQLPFDVHHISDAADKVQPTKHNNVIRGFISFRSVEHYSQLLLWRLCVEKVGRDQSIMGELLLQWNGLLDSLKQAHTISSRMKGNHVT